MSLPFVAIVTGQTITCRSMPHEKHYQDQKQHDIYYSQLLFARRIQGPILQPKSKDNQKAFLMVNSIINSFIITLLVATSDG